jgi:hypothetical protein
MIALSLEDTKVEIVEAEDLGGTDAAAEVYQTKRLGGG